MIKLTINNSVSNIVGLNPKEFQELRTLMSYKSDNQRFYNTKYYNNIKYLMDKRGFFPSGLLRIAQDYLSEVEYAVDDKRIVPAINNNLFKLNLWLSPYLEQMDAVNSLTMAKQGTVSAVTGSGKSLMMALLINRLQVKTLVIVPTLALKHQLSKFFNDVFGKHSLQLLRVENIDSKALKTAIDYDLLIIDEAHRSAAKTYRKLNAKQWSNIFYRANFTATPFRSREEEQLLMESITGPVVYTLDYKTAVEKKYIVPIEAFYYDLPVTEVKGDPTSWANVYSELVVNNQFRNNLIRKVCLHLGIEEKSTLCLVKEIKHGDILSWNQAFRFANGENEETQDIINNFNKRGPGKVIIGTVGVLGEGVDTKPCEYIIIAGLGKSKNQFMQSIGRALRNYSGKDSAKIVIFRDTSHKWTLTHFRTQRKVLKDVYGIKPIKLEIE